MPKTTINMPSKLFSQLEKLQKEIGSGYFKDAWTYAVKKGLNIIIPDQDLDAESVYEALDIVSQKVECTKMKQSLPIYRLPCFHEYLKDSSILSVEQNRVHLNCTHECEFRHATTTNAKSGIILKMILCFMFTHLIGNAVGKFIKIIEPYSELQESF